MLRGGAASIPLGCHPSPYHAHGPHSPLYTSLAPWPFICYGKILYLHFTWSDFFYMVKLSSYTTYICLEGSS